MTPDFPTKNKRLIFLTMSWSLSTAPGVMHTRKIGRKAKPQPKGGEEVQLSGRPHALPYKAAVATTASQKSRDVVLIQPHLLRVGNHPVGHPT